MNLSQKKEFVAKLKSKLAESQILLLVNYKGLNVAATTELRNELRKEASCIEVVKNSLLSRAIDGTHDEVIKDAFVGPNAIVTCSEDPVAPARVIVKFAQSNDKFEIKIGAMDGKLLEIDDIKALAKLPAKDALLAQLLSAMNGVPTAMVRVLNEVPRSMLNVLNAIREQKEAA